MCVRECVRACASLRGCSDRGGFKAVDRFNNSCSCAASSLFPDPSVLSHRRYTAVYFWGVFNRFRFLVSLPVTPPFHLPLASSPTPPHPFILTIPPSFLPLFPFSPPPAEKVTPRHKQPPIPSPCLPPFSLCLTLFQSFQPSFFHRTFSLGSPPRFLSSSVHFLVSLCHFEFSCVFLPFFFISCIPSV